MSTHKWPPPSGLTEAELRSLAQDHKDDIIAECLATIRALQADVAARDRVIEAARRMAGLRLNTEPVLWIRAALAEFDKEASR